MADDIDNILTVLDHNYTALQLMSEKLTELETALNNLIAAEAAQPKCRCGSCMAEDTETVKGDILLHVPEGVPFDPTTDADAEWQEVEADETASFLERLSDEKRAEFIRRMDELKQSFQQRMAKQKADDTASFLERCCRTIRVADTKITAEEFELLGQMMRNQGATAVAQLHARQKAEAALPETNELKE